MPQTKASIAMSINVALINHARRIISHAELARGKPMLDSERRFLLRKLMRGRWSATEIRAIVERLAALQQREISNA